jgi:hypothetical protein
MLDLFNTAVRVAQNQPAPAKGHMERTVGVAR